MYDDFVNKLRMASFISLRLPENYDFIELLEIKGSELLKEIKEVIFSDSKLAEKHCLLWIRKILLEEERLRAVRLKIKNSRTLPSKPNKQQLEEIKKILHQKIEAIDSVILISEDVRYEIAEYLETYFPESEKNHQNYSDLKPQKIELQEEANIFNDMPLKEVREHFIQLCQTKSKTNSQPFLTQNQLDIFIQRAFVGNKMIDRIIMNKGSKDGKLIQSIFLSYWNECKRLDIYRSVNSNSQADYLKLLTENFIGFDFDKLKVNFHKQK